MFDLGVLGQTFLIIVCMFIGYVWGYNEGYGNGDKDGRWYGRQEAENED